jgi:arginyl-tRNA synthetase
LKRAHLHLSEQLRAALSKAGVENPDVTLEKPRDPSHGDVASNAALAFAKRIGKPPKVIAEKIVSDLTLDTNLVQFSSIAGPGFLNFRFAPRYLQSIVQNALQAPTIFGNSDEMKGKRVLIEFVSANPSGPLNVVSARAAAVGDTLCRHFRARGSEADSEFYVNDAGNQVELLGQSVFARYASELGQETPIPEGGYHGDYLIEFAKELTARHGDAFLRKDRALAEQELGRLAIERHVAMHQVSLERFGSMSGLRNSATRKTG